MRQISFTALAMGTGLALAAGGGMTAAQTGAESPKPLQLRSIMKEMGENMLRITDAVSREEWALAEKAALAIASHPRPPLMEKTRIVAFIGTDMGKYKNHDDKTTGAAQAVAEASAKKDGPAVIAAFKELQMSCHNCHRDFRRSFVEYFYGERG